MRLGVFARGPVASQRGVALIFTLMLVVILSAVILAFLITMRADRQQTFSYGNAIKANEMAFGALQQITGNLRGEISDYSTALTVSGVTVYQPKDRYAVAPLRVGFDAEDYGTDADGEKLPPTLLQVSRSGSDSAASEVSTTAASANGRAISPTRWNLPLLLSGSQGKVPAAFVEQPPQWIYLTRAGSRLCTDAEARDGSLSAAVLSNTNAVLGRYAFVIYDEGALLDVNVAGYLYSATSTSPTLREELRGKSSAAYADLTRLPGLDKTDGKTLVENFVNWRNKGALSLSGSNDYVKVVANSATTGFLRFTGSDGAYDNPLLGRRDLLDYLQKVVGNTAAAPYLSTFSRVRAAPSYAPPRNAADIQPGRGSNTYVTSIAPTTFRADAESDFRYADHANDEKLSASGTAYVINPNLANVRHKRAATVRHWRDDGTTHADYQVRAGEPLLASRFSLKRLEWLSHDPYHGTPPDSSKAAAIRACFGLVWGRPGDADADNATNGGNPCWNYKGAAGNGFPDRIKTLAEVAAENPPREPDFFELLKAAILNGSLGKHVGKAAYNDGGQGYPNYEMNSKSGANIGQVGMFCRVLDPLGKGKAPAPGLVPDMQIMQIGANIIDQWDADSYPTAIYFRYLSDSNADKTKFDPAKGVSASPQFGPACMVFGNENLPYLNKVLSLVVTPNRPRDTPDDTIDRTIDYPEADSIGGWFQPEIYNPHQAPATPLTDTPRDFQIRAYGSAWTTWSWDAKLPPFTHARGDSEVVTWFETNSKSEVCDKGVINLTDSSGTAFYERPFAIRNDPLYPSVIASSPADVNVAKKNFPFWNKKSGVFTNHFVAFNAGVTDPGAADRFYVNPNVNPHAYVRPANLPSACTFILGWVDRDGGFHPYSYLTGVFTSAYLVNMSNGTTGMGSVWPGDLNPCPYFLMDPRTSRFSLMGAFFGAGPGINSTFFQNTRSPSIVNQGHWPVETGFYYGPTANIYPPLVGWGVNYPTSDVAQQSTIFTNPLAYYADPDGVVRPADGWHTNYPTLDGHMMFGGVGTGSAAAGDNTSARHGRRPIILNRPFRSVGELGYVFRDVPFKTLDLFTPYSADASLLDVFCLQDNLTVSGSRAASISAGLLNLSNAPRPVFEALLAGAGKKEADAAYNLGAADAGNLARNISNYFSVSGTNPPLASRADLVTTLSGTIRAAFTATADKANKAYLEAPVRALAEVADTRTWNLLIDVIAQSGRMSPSADKLEKFIVEGERRYWLHLAIDRYTGQIIDQQLEPVYE